MTTPLGFSSWSTINRIPYLPKPAAATPRFSGRELIRDVGRALSNRNYVMLLFGLFFVSTMVGVRGGLCTHAATLVASLTRETTRPGLK